MQEKQVLWFCKLGGELGKSCWLMTLKYNYMHELQYETTQDHEYHTWSFVGGLLRAENPRNWSELSPVVLLGWISDEGRMERMI